MKENRITFGQSFCATSAAGIVARTLTSPFEVVQVMRQVGCKSTSAGLMHSFRNIYEAEGIRAFWKGNGASCAKSIPHNFAQFSTFFYLRTEMSDGLSGMLSPAKAFVAGTAGGIVATFVTYPLDLIKTRLTVQNSRKSVRKYTGICSAAKMIYREEGFRTFYRGVVPAVLGHVPYSGGTFVTYELLEKIISRPRHQRSALEHFLHGCSASALALVIAYPFDTVKKRLQVQSAGANFETLSDASLLRGMIDGFVQTVRQRGARGLWSGYKAGVLKVVPFAGVMFCTFETVKSGFVYHNGYTTSPFSNKPKSSIPQDIPPLELRRWKRQQQQQRRDHETDQTRPADQ
ncbi:mitochondrial solute carrier family 25 member 43 [Andalucia godoyi]|uniref:Mitochondrial solute carrier family 25 member 43 n=1 Tax=Andalucia godoyi TaxID=505711 RepID=A0A8K0AI83_ANDGO|nr:mitochondrial solute carrier family 25 member 43 [Andalucia godoyi]|eukprot:ANDGO_04384.mRNA.1 mitochondrial solute carrier family 25 member 43